MNSMESSLVVDQSFSPGKQMKKTPQNVNHPPHYNLHQTAGGGLLLSRNIPRQSSNLSQNYATTPPPHVMHEYDKMMMMMTMMTPGGFYLNNNNHHHHHLTNSFPPQVMHGPHQPPLLPLPPAVSRPAFHSQPPLRRSQSLSPPVLVPRKAPAKNKAPPPKKENKKGILHNNNNSVQLSSSKVARKRSQVSTGPTKEIGPNNPDLTRMMSDVEMDGPVFRMAPPPSSLPLPRFTLRKPSPPPPPPMKLMRCNAEAAADDGAATDNICMLLRLR